MTCNKELINLLNELRQKKIKTAIATSASKKRMNAVLKQLNLKEYFDTLVCDDDVSKSKPAPDIYIQTAKKLRVSPNKCWVIEDTDSGILSSTAAGMNCILFDKYTPKGKLFDKAELSSNSFEHIRTILEKLN